MNIGVDSLNDAIVNAINNESGFTGSKNFTVTPTLSSTITTAIIGGSENNLVSRKFTDQAYVTNTDDSTINFLKTFEKIPRLSEAYHAVDP